MDGEGAFREVHFPGEEFVQLAHVAVFAADLGDVTVDVIDFGRAPFGEVLIHGRIVQRMCHAGGVQDGFDFAFAGAEQSVSCGFGGRVGFVHELFGEPACVGMRVEFAESDLIHRAQGVEYRIEHDLRHTHADEVVHDGRVERRGLEVLVQFLFDRPGLLVVGAHVHGLGVGATGEVEITRPVHVCADQCRATVDAVLGEVFVELLEMPVAVHRGEHDLMILEQVGATLEHAVELHLLEEHDPHVRFAVVFLRVVHVDRHQMAVLTVLGDVGAALFADLLDVRLPSVDEVDVLVRELLQQNTILDTHSACADHRVFHGCLLPPFVLRLVLRPPIVITYPRFDVDGTAWLYALVMEGLSTYKACL